MNLLTKKVKKSKNLKKIHNFISNVYKIFVRNFYKVC